MTRPPTFIKPYTELTPTCSSYEDDAKRQATLVGFSLNADADISEGDPTTAAQGNIDERVRHAITIMEQYLHRDLNINAIASHVNLSRCHFCHLFKSETDSSPAQYLKSLRLRKAKELLESTFLNFKQIKCRVGVKDESHFARSFKKAFGTAPAQYRARYFNTRVIETALLTGMPKAARK